MSMDRDKMTIKDKVIMAALSILCLVAVMASQCGCNSQTVKPSNELANAVKGNQKTAQEMQEKITTLSGDLTKVQQSFTSFKSEVETTINQKFETLQDSVKTGDVGDDVITNKNSNSALYGIGLVAVVLIFVLAFIWLMAHIAKGAVAKFIK